MVSTRFGDFRPLCTNTPSYPWCNLFFRQLQRTNTSLVPDPATAPSGGVNPVCGIPPVFSPTAPHPALGNIANIVVCALAFLFTLALVALGQRRKAAVGRVEFRALLVLYAITLPLQLVDTGGLVRQGSTGLVVVTSIHAGFVAALFWTLLGNAIVATQIVEDGTLASLVPFYIFSVLFFAATTYLSLDTGLGFTTVVGGASDPPEALRSISLFVFLNIWPAAAAITYFVLMAYIVVRILNERRPMIYYSISALLFVLAQLAWFLLGKVICQRSNQRVDGAFIATILETASVGFLYLAWRSITESSWDEDAYYNP